MGDLWCHSLEINFSLVMSSPGGPVMVMGKYYPKMQCSIMITAFLMFGAKTKIVLTGVRSRVRESLAKWLIKYFLICTFYFTLLISL